MSRLSSRTLLLQLKKSLIFYIISDIDNLNFQQQLSVIAINCSQASFEKNYSRRLIFSCVYLPRIIQRLMNSLNVSIRSSSNHCDTMSMFVKSTELIISFTSKSL